MQKFESYQLSNKLKVILYPDASTEMVVVNTLYDVGSRDEDPAQTGFAHLFEHLMFGGSINIPEFDEPLQVAGGENNAYTTNDITNYYIQIPKENIETALWLESDRMVSLAFSPESLEVQRKVVCEEFKEHYINKPYGDVWKHLRTLAYKQHPYQWMTIGKELSHIEDATLDDVKAFFHKHYNPSNAILCIAGNIDIEATKALVEKWYGDIPAGTKYNRNIPAEPVQKEARQLTIHADVPVSALYKTYHIAGRLHKEYYIADILSDILGSGKTARLYNQLVKEEKLFSEIQCYHTGSIEPGLLVIEGKIVNGIDHETANAAIEKVVKEIIESDISELELQKIKNKIESMIVFEDTNLMNMANNLAFFELLGDAGLMDKELQEYQSVKVSEMKEIAGKILHSNNCATLFYLSKETSPTS